MPEQRLRFGVRTEDGRSTDVWKCWTNTGTGRRDVYLTSRPLGHAIKLSLHEGGRWHVGFDAAKRDQLFEPERLPPTRFLGAWTVGAASTAQLILAARVNFPHSSPSEAPRGAPKDTVWLPPAPEDQMVEVALFLVNVESPWTDWPGKNVQGTKLVGNLALEHGGRVCVVHRNVPMPSGGLPRSGTPNYFRGKTKADLPGVNRLVIWGQEPDGSISFIEARAVVMPKGAA